MKISNKLKSYLFVIAYLVIGLLILGLAELISLPGRLSSSVVVWILFVLLNLATAKVFRLNNELVKFWSPGKIGYLPLGIFAGALIASIPALAGLATGRVGSDVIVFNASFTILSVVLTFVIVTWEELWFRGIFLNYCHRYLSDVTISVIIGSLFMLIHVLNPEINLLRTGPTLFFAGALLTIVYFYFKTIWLPVGMHFGNNYLALETNVKDHWLFGNDGYMSALVLAGLYLLFVRLSVNRAKSQL